MLLYYILLFAMHILFYLLLPLKTPLGEVLMKFNHVCTCLYVNLHNNEVLIPLKYLTLY